jgi:arabinose-5-phosphate isomerase
MNYTDCAKKVFTAEIVELERVAGALGNEINTAVELIYASVGKVVITGIGKAGIVGRKIAASLASTGTNAVFINAAEAQHGDLGMVCKGDVIIAISNSGETHEVLALIPVFKALKCPIIAITGNVKSALATASDVTLNAHVESEACPLGLAPTSSATAELVMGDALMVCLIERRGFCAEDFALYHPGGALGRKLLTQVKNIMRTNNDPFVNMSATLPPAGGRKKKGDDAPPSALPIVRTDTAFKDIIYEVGSKCLGMTLVCDKRGDVVGVITDGDIRRAFGKHAGGVMTLTAADFMSPNYKTITQDKMINEALAIMERHKITTLVVQEPESLKPLGIISMHDIIEMR